MLLLSHFTWDRPCVTPWTVACQAPLSMGFSRQEYQSDLHGIFPRKGFEPTSLTFPALVGRLFATRPPGKPQSSTQWFPMRGRKNGTGHKIKELENFLQYIKEDLRQ